MFRTLSRLLRGLDLGLGMTERARQAHMAAEFDRVLPSWTGWHYLTMSVVATAIAKALGKILPGH